MRDKLLSGDLDAAHALYGLVYGVQLGIGGPQTDMAVLMVLNRNGQAITLSNALADALAEHGSLKALATLGRKPVFAQTFPTGTHAMWLYYWLASQGVHPLRDIESVVIPPPQMVAALAEDKLDGLCVGEPWNALAEAQGVGRTVAYTSDVWPDHPEKVLACRRDFVARIRIRRARSCRRCSKRAAGSTARASRGDRGAARRARVCRRPRELIEPRLAAHDRRVPRRAARALLRRRHGQLSARVEGAWFLTQFGAGA